MSNGRMRAVDLMRARGVSEAAIAVFEHNYRLLESGATGVIPESDIAPLTDPAEFVPGAVDPDRGREALAATAIIKLNGGLGTSMGLDAAKTLLPLRDGFTFLDVLVQQVLQARRRYGVRLPLMLMNSFRTDADTNRALARYPELPVAGLPLSFVQNQEPKLLADTLEPVSWPADPSLEWCPPGHGDLFTVLWASGLVDRLLQEGFRYVSVANGDNLGAAPSPELAAWFAASGAPYAAEVCVRTANDRKGGHLAVRRRDGRLVLRDVAMVAPGEMDYFTDESRHPYFNANNLWFDLRALRDALALRHGVLELPLIRNVKHVDPTDRTSPQVIQLETGMGTAVEVFDGAAAIAVPRSRFLPVKTTNELLLLRSDRYRLRDDFTVEQTAPGVPEVWLDPAYFQSLADFDRRIPVPPSLRDATALRVDGDWTFRPGTTVIGSVGLPDRGAPQVATGRLS